MIPLFSHSRKDADETTAAFIPSSDASGVRQTCQSVRYRFFTYICTCLQVVDHFGGLGAKMMIKMVIAVMMAACTTTTS